MHLYLSLVTVPGHSEQASVAAEPAWHRATCEADGDEITCIAWALDDEPVQAVYRGLLIGGTDRVEETDLLVAFFRLLTEKLCCPLVFVGHDVRCILRVLYQRAVVRGVRPPLPIPHDVSIGFGSVYDTMTTWGGKGGHITLEKLYALLGLSTQNEPATREASGQRSSYELLELGEIEQMVEHCQFRVEQVRQVHQRLIFDTLPLQKRSATEGAQ
ncbi:MAG: hypothetical protein GXP17_03030 [Gammaproteobacteria bacterium]|nr:hypothetical protein [Gammaproteobacteria bacterium]